MALATRALMAEQLLGYGEIEAAAWILVCGEDDLFKVNGISSWLTIKGPTTPAGNSMTFRKAIALAAVNVREGHPRQLRQKRFAKGGELPGELPPHAHENIWPPQALGPYYGVTEQIEAYWQNQMEG